ncbi:unnamed protein product [Closterium sp. Naga37s-1]|nr:unnamed protein product [Closterium sp. Naga37s-1]
MAKDKGRVEKGKRKQGRESKKQHSQPTRRFRFKSFTRQVEEAQVDVFRSLAPAQQQPSAGCSSFFQQTLLHWRELSAAVDFNEVHSEVAPLVASLPQLVFHRHRIVHALLQRLPMRALLSLPPLLRCPLLSPSPPLRPPRISVHHPAIHARAGPAARLPAVSAATAVQSGGVLGGEGMA